MNQNDPNRPTPPLKVPSGQRVDISTPPPKPKKKPSKITENETRLGAQQIQFRKKYIGTTNPSSQTGERDVTLTQLVKAFGSSDQSVTVGIAGAASWPDEPRFNPNKILKNASTVIVFSIPTLDTITDVGSLRHEILIRRETRRMLEQIQLKVAKLLHKHQFRAVIVPDEVAYDSPDLIHELSYPALYRTPVNFHIAGEQAGIGTIGLNGLLLTEDYGPRVQLGAIITDAPLVAGSPLEKNLCTLCYSCVNECPQKAISKDAGWNNWKCLVGQAQFGTKLAMLDTLTCPSYCSVACPVGAKRLEPSTSHYDAFHGHHAFDPHGHIEEDKKSQIL